MSAPFQSSTDVARIGPNAVIQLGETLIAHGARKLAGEIYLAAGHPGWLARPPLEMVDERDVAQLHAALRRMVEPDMAQAYAGEAGMRTADYILARRIPRAARMVVRLLPAPIAARMLLESIDAHAWTFAGSGRFSYVFGMPVVVEIAANPLATGPGCDWHTAVLRRLFQSLVHASAEVVETACCGAGDTACRFEVSWPPVKVAS